MVCLNLHVLFGIRFIWCIFLENPSSSRVSPDTIETISDERIMIKGRFLELRFIICKWILKVSSVPLMRVIHIARNMTSENCNASWTFSRLKRWIWKGRRFDLHRKRICIKWNWRRGFDCTPKRWGSVLRLLNRYHVSVPCRRGFAPNLSFSFTKGNCSRSRFMEQNLFLAKMQSGLRR
jgi:hypothetical protein